MPRFSNAKSLTITDCALLPPRLHRVRTEIAVQRENPSQGVWDV